jgi:hypothetical protein
VREKSKSLAMVALSAAENNTFGHKFVFEGLDSFEDGRDGV